MDTKNKFKDTHGGIPRLIAIMIFLIAVLSFSIAIPKLNASNYEMQCRACEQAMKSATDGLKIEAITTDNSLDIESSKEVISQVMPARDNICPNGGTVYLIKNEQEILVPICGMHDSDSKRKTRLNASYSKSIFENKINEQLLLNPQKLDLDEIDIFINNQKILPEILDEENQHPEKIRFKLEPPEAKIYYRLDENNKLEYFMYVEKGNYAQWDENGWSGNAYKEN